MPDHLQAPSGRYAAHVGGSYLSNVAFPAWISLFGPRPNFHISLARQGGESLEWTDEGRHHGLASFQMDKDSLITREPIKAIPRGKPCQV